MNPANVPGIYHHSFLAGNPVADLDLTPSAAPTAEDEKLCVRLLSAFEAALATCKDPFEQDQWSTVHRKVAAPVLDAVEKADPRALAHVLCNGLRQEFGFGLGSGPGWYKLALGEKAPVVSNVIIDRTVALAEAWGLVSLENPEDASCGTGVYVNLDSLVDSLEKRAGHSVGAPAYFGLYGIRVGGRLLSLRSPDALYASERLAALGESALEIGGGFGLTAFHAHQRGLKRYAILDLPLVNLFQGYFLCKAIGGERVRLFGERDAGQSVAIHPYFGADRLRQERFDTVYAQDVLPELSSDKITFYVDFIVDSRPQRFLTINHESSYAMSADGGPGPRQENISRRLAGDPRLTRLSRFPYWIRKGYVEELYGLA